MAGFPAIIIRSHKLLCGYFRMPQILSPSIETSAAQLSHLERGKYYDEELITPPSNVQKIIAELVGTYILIFIGCGSAFVDQRSNITLIGVALAWGVVVTALIYTVGHVSGAHFNPAVTVAFATTGRFPWKNVPLYVVAQLLGSILASVNLGWLFSEVRADVMLTLPSSTTNDLEVIAMEIIVSFILMFVICGAADDERAIKQLSGVAVGATIFIDVLIAGKVTGASMNPARSIGPAVAARNAHKIWIYIVAPLIGTVAGSAFYRLLRLPRKVSEMTIKSPLVEPRNNPIYSGKSIELP